MEHIERTDRKLVYKGTILDIYEDAIKTPTGHTAKWDFISHKGAAAVVPVMDDGRILMVRQYRNALDRFTLEIPAGALDYVGEPKIECAARELEEETGYRSDHLEWLINVNTTVAFCNELIGIYVATELIPSVQHLDEDEFVEVLAFTPKELCGKIFSGEITDGKTIAAIMAYMQKNSHRL